MGQGGAGGGGGGGEGGGEGLVCSSWDFLDVNMVYIYI